MKTSQNARLLQYLKTHRNGISQLEAFNKLGICRLSERIAELEGWRVPPIAWRKGKYAVIRHIRERVQTRYGQCYVVRYKLA